MTTPTPAFAVGAKVRLAGDANSPKMLVQLVVGEGTEAVPFEYETSWEDPDNHVIGVQRFAESELVRVV